MVNILHEISTYNIARGKIDSTKLLQLLKEVSHFLQCTEVHPVAYQQIHSLVNSILQDLSPGTSLEPYALKNTVANIRDVAIILKSQLFRFRKQCTHTDEKQGSNLILCCYMHKIIEKTVSYSFMHSMLSTLIDLWNLHIENTITTKHLIHPLNMGSCPSQVISNDHKGEETDYLKYIFTVFLWVLLW